MRVMVLALVLANALFFMWSTWVAEPPATAVPRSAGGASELQLLSELDNAPPSVAENDAANAVLEPMLEATAEVDAGQPAEGDAGPEEAATAGASDAAAPALAAASPPAPAEAPDAEAPDAGESALPPPSVLDDIESLAEDTAQAVQLALADTPQRCASLGPFSNLEAATGAASRLSEVGLAPRQRQAEEQVWVGHWVYLPSYATRDEAVAVVEGLREQGVKDIYIEPSGDRENAVSLGLFSDRENAELYAGQVRQYEVRPQITDRYRLGTAHWVDIEIPAAQAVDPAAYQPDQVTALRLEPRDCAAAAAERDTGN